MKKLFVFLLAAMFSGSVWGQSKERIAIYVTGGKEEGDNDVLSGMLTEAITKSTDYVAVERTADFLQQLRKEQNYQRSGNVDDNDIARLGKQSGAKYVCVAELMPVQGGDFITTRLIDVEKASVMATADGADKISSLDMLVKMSETIAKQLITSISSRKTGIPKQRVAVYVSGNDVDGINKVLGAKLVSALTGSSEYVAMERTDAFLKQLSNETDYQQSGNVEDTQIARLGKQFGVKYVCAAKISSSSYGGKFLKASLIDVETAEVNSTANASLTSTDLNSLIDVAQKIATQLLKNIGGLGTKRAIGYPNPNDVIAKFVDGTLTISGKGAMNDVSNWGDDESKIKKIIIQEGVTTIGDFAFYGCNNVNTIVIPNSVTSIGNRAFQNCSRLSSIVIPNSLASIGEASFIGCESLKTITIPNSVTSIGAYAFCGCKALTSITIPYSVTDIGEGAFVGCTSLESITIPNKSIKESAFYRYRGKVKRL